MVVRQYGKGWTADMDFATNGNKNDTKTSMLSQDLDIFWDEWTEWESGSDATMDMFNDKEDASTEETPKDSTGWEDNTKAETPEAESKEKAEDNTEDKAWEDKEWEGTSTSDDDLDAEINKLLWLDKEIADKADQVKEQADKENVSAEFLKLIDELQDQLSDQQLANTALQKKNDILSDKYMGAVWDYEGMAMSKDIIDKIDQNPKLKILVKYYGNDNPTMKTKITSILSDLVQEITWEDISELISKAEKSKVAAALWTPSWNYSPSSPTKPVEEEKDMSYEDSIDKLF